MNEYAGPLTFVMWQLVVIRENFGGKREIFYCKGFVIKKPILGGKIFREAVFYFLFPEFRCNFTQPINKGQYRKCCQVNIIRKGLVFS